MNIRTIAAVAPCAIALAASLGLAGQASATVHNLTYQGVVVQANDNTGEFGAGANLVGMSFTALINYDDAKAGATYTGDVFYDDYRGAGAANPLSVTVMLNGYTRVFGETEGHDYRMDRTLLPNCTLDCSDVRFQQSAENRYTQNGLYTLDYINLGGMRSDGTLSGLAHTAPNYTNPPYDIYAYVSVFQQDVQSLELRHDASVLVKLNGVTGAVPEPGAWALMLVGFGGVGSLLRRRRAAGIATA